MRKGGRNRTVMNELSAWLREQLRRRDLTQTEAAVYAGVGQATISDIINKGHVPKIETLFRLADFFDTSREQVLRAAGHLPPPGQGSAERSGVLDIEGEDEELVRSLLYEFHRLPAEWKQVAVDQVAVFRRLAEVGPAHFIGEGPARRARPWEGEEHDAQQAPGDEAEQAA